MQQMGEKVEYVVGDASVVERMRRFGGREIFSSAVEDFLQAISARLLHDKAAKKYSDVVTFAFWCRRSSVQTMRQAYVATGRRRGRGVVLHIAPANVAVNFAYSFVSGMLAGNANIVRLPSKPFVQVDLICQAVQHVLKEGFADLRNMICFVRYGHDAAVTGYFSDICTTRIIWGGDMTIEAIRRIPLQPRANEVTFADRFSLAVINADVYLRDGAKAGLAQAFYNDTYLSDQNACTSPRLVVWLGESVTAAQEIFWQELHKVVVDKYKLEPKQAVDKVVAAYKLAALGGCRIIEMPDNLLMRIAITELTEQLCRFRVSSGLFIEYVAKDLAEILPVCGCVCQTVAVYGVEQADLVEFIERKCPQGIDRIVPVGKTLDFSLVWDGVDLIQVMSRYIVF